MKEETIKFYLREVCDTINEVFKTANINYSVDDYNKPLTGEPFSLNGINMVYLFMGLERRLGKPIYIPVEDKYCFFTIRTIAEFLTNQSSSN